jgi:hypothetical protein
MKPLHFSAWALCALSVACRSSEPSKSADGSFATGAFATPVLYARDGTAVPADPSANEAAEAAASMQAPVAHDAKKPQLPSRIVEGVEDGRPTILALYQRVIAERDALRSNASAQAAELERLRLALADAEHRAGDQTTAALAFEAELARAKAENLDLAGRLTTAQIRRLQAEKLLLERGIDPAHARTPSTDAPVGAAGMHKP